eukprot:CAMPEP_0119147438 /NCGR_PEP_ID=MMETSP1310-20130426/40357_1 /TAXON_ID=464262 /ORGANISM="Genus nov. species nov., Strain RCC2339" /LENGTH=1050 /DNA_ID=CAMNT_0007139409 /DNA_START=120 /DNA_END=3272 /DNA_ORIENTATION=+
MGVWGEAPRQTGRQACKVGVIINAIGLVGSPFNSLAVEGAQAAAVAAGCEQQTYEPTEDEFDVYMTFIDQAVADGSGIIITVGFVMGEVTFAGAEKYPDTTFGIVDFAYSEDLPNLAGLVFREDQAGYLAGAFAALVNEDLRAGVFGSIGACQGGFAIPPVLKFCNGFRAGIKDACAECGVFIEYVPSFEDQELGRQVANELADAGAQYLFGAGGGMGSAAIKDFSQRPNGLVIGVDADEYFSTFESGGAANSDATNLITSALKNISLAVETTTTNFFNDAFLSGTQVFDASVDGVGLAPCHQSCAFVSEETSREMAIISEALSQGAIITGINPISGNIALYEETTELQWSTLLPTGIRPEGLYGHSMVSFTSGNATGFYLFGGRNASVVAAGVFRNDVWKYDYDSNSWALQVPSGVGPIPIARTGHSVALYLQRYMIIFGGTDEAGTVLDDTWFFDTDTNTWSEIGGSSGILGRRSTAMAIVEDTLFVYGGQGSTLVLSDVWSLDLLTAIGATRRGNAPRQLGWVEQSVTFDDSGDAIVTGRFGHGSVSNDTRIFFAGGRLSSQQLTNEVLVLDTATLIMSRVTRTTDASDPPPAFAQAATSSFEDDMYFFGGVSDQALLNSVYRYNLYTGEWVRLVPETAFSPNARTNTAAVPLVTTVLNSVGETIQEARLFAYGGLSLTAGSESRLEVFGLPANPTIFDTFLSCDAETVFQAPRGLIDFNPISKNNDIFPIEYECDGYVDCENLFDERNVCSPSVESMFYAFAVVLGFCLLFCLGLLVFLVVFRNDKVILTSSRNFLMISVLGAMMSYIALYLFFPYPTDGICSAQIWILTLGFITMLAPLLVKTYRIVKIFRAKTFFLKPLSDLELFLRLLLLYVPVLIILIVLQAVGEPGAKLRKEQGADCETLDKRHVICSTDDIEIYAGVLIAYFGLLLLSGVVLAVLTRHVQTAYNESQFIALSIYNFFFLGCVGVPMFFLLDEEPEIRLIILVVLVGVACTGFLMLLFFPKMYIIYHGGQDEYDQKMSSLRKTVGTSSGGGNVDITSMMDD